MIILHQHWVMQFILLAIFQTQIVNIAHDGKQKETHLLYITFMLRLSKRNNYIVALAGLMWLCIDLTSCKA